MAKVTQQSVAAKEAEVKRQKAAEESITGLTAEAEELERSNKVLRTTHNDLQEQNQELVSQIKVSNDMLDDLRQQETELVTRNSELSTEIEAKTGELDIINDNLKAKTSDLGILTEQFDTTKEKNERELGILQAKKEAVIQEVLDNKAHDDKVRENLASWAKTLDDKDKNLRIREAQVNHQQQAIARNANLLNL